MQETLPLKHVFDLIKLNKLRGRINVFNMESLDTLITLPRNIVCFERMSVNAHSHPFFFP